MFLEVKLVDEVYAFPRSGPEVAASFGFARNNHSQLNQSCIRCGAQIRRLNGWADAGNVERALPLAAAAISSTVQSALDPLIEALLQR